MAEMLKKLRSPGRYSGEIEIGDKSVNVSINPTDWGGYQVHYQKWTNLDKPYASKTTFDKTENFDKLKDAKKSAENFLSSNNREASSTRGAGATSTSNT